MESEEVRLTFRKGAHGKKNSVVIESGRGKLVIKTWEHGIIPHELVHYAVESVFGELRGFLRLIGEGRDIAEIEGRKGGLPAAYIECLVGAFQYELWGSAAADDETFLRNFRDFTARHTEMFPVAEFFEFVPDAGRIGTCRQMLRDLTREWESLSADAALGRTMNI